jgi:sugar/nucleoside kinase (ribokinase family)
MITVIGNVNFDLVMGPSAAWPAPGTEVIVPRCEWRPGGAAGNCALALAALGSPHRVIANRGADQLGSWLAEPFAEHARNWTLSQAPTALSVGISHPDGERTFFTHLGHLAEFSLSDVLLQLPANAVKDEIALVCGSFVSPKLLPACLELLTVLKARGFQVALDTGWPDAGWSEPVRQTVLSWLASCDHVLINESEARGLAGLGDAPVEAVATALLDARIAANATLCIKQGAHGAMAWRGRQRWHAAAPAVKVIDTIGAGDVFNAGYLHGLSQQLSTQQALELGAATASLAIATAPRKYSAKPAE